MFVLQKKNIENLNPISWENSIILRYLRTKFEYTKNLRNKDTQNIESKLSSIDSFEN